MSAYQNRTIRILLLEDDADDAEEICRVLRAAGLSIEVHLVSDEPGFREQLAHAGVLDIILSDFSLPTYDGLSALILRAMLAPELPFIFVTGSLGEERAVEMLHIGASDYVLKGNLQRLPIAVLRALAEADDARIRASMQQQLNTERQLLSAVLDTAGALIVLVDRSGRIVRMNPAATLPLPQAHHQADGLPFVEVFATHDERTAVTGQLARMRQAEHPGPVSWRSTVNGRVILWSATHLTSQEESAGFAVISGLDITAQEEAEQQAYYLRHFDSASGLPNRSLLLLRMQRLVQTAVGRPTLVMVGLSRLQDIRDSLGDEAANRLLREVSRRLLSCQVAGDCLARIGDDSFALLCMPQPDDALDASLQDMLTQLHQPYAFDSRSFFLSAHLGVAFCEQSASPEEVLQAATMALHRAIQQQSEGYHFYQPLLSDEARARLELEGELHLALAANDQLYLDYQPQADIRSGRIVGLEALMRWRHPRLGLVGPMRFIPLAESCGLIAALGDKALDLACRQAVHWQNSGLPPVPVAVNLSAVQWSQPGLADTIRQALTQSGLAPQWLELELTESASMHNPMATLATMKALREMGVMMSIDDFGTGFCNLSYLKRFPVDKLKIDQSFVREITSLPDDLVISQLVVAMGHLLHLSVVAEGVETEGQLTLLAEAGCDIIQGYYFSRPVSAEACGELMAGGKRLPPTKRRYDPHYLLWLDPSGDSLAQARSWLAATDYKVLEAHAIQEAFELMATHEIGVVVAGKAQAEMSGATFLSRIASMYPSSTGILLGDESLGASTGATQITLGRPIDRALLLNALEQGYARHAGVQRG
ncbi:EAL domain-containing protein [Paludibacterium purpuratum]|uniref:PAS domain S-box-containing protein/diguanylate cyclase (GGDEF)-like protein n=1 Tax=Paludibacterium purpuratum TaxID=1144873 RepID=A0A4R7B0G7_9NEIS|nr:EAL domain-containing protein [Paludibacterium purpuratum]TDR73924.1 PAS domain S-box-containing protein/diguanylate cyclase (GGDEF)-like protein [Paludibacterium purpuratum]